jgi:hypothetical protein
MFGESTTVRQARRIFSDWMNNNKTISPNLREVVYTAGSTISKSNKAVGIEIII